MDVRLHGFNLTSDVPRREALKALEGFAFHELRCAHIELMDRNLTVEDAATLGFEFRNFQTYEVNLNRSEEEALCVPRQRCSSLRSQVGA